MSHMKDKIKNLFSFLGRAWQGGIRGKVGILFALFALLAFTRILFGQMNIVKFIRTSFQLNSERRELTAERKKLETINLHIQLLQNYSPDYVEELGLRHLNIGNPNFKVLKI